MAHGHGDRFPFEKAHKLDSDERRKLQPPEPAVEALGVQPGNVVIDLGVGTGFPRRASTSPQTTTCLP